MASPIGTIGAALELCIKGGDGGPAAEALDCGSFESTHLFSFSSYRKVLGSPRLARLGPLNWSSDDDPFFPPNNPVINPKTPFLSPAVPIVVLDLSVSVSDLFRSPKCYGTALRFLFT